MRIVFSPLAGDGLISYGDWILPPPLSGGRSLSLAIANPLPSASQIISGKRVFMEGRVGAFGGCCCGIVDI